MANKTSIIVGGVGGALPFIIDLLHVDAASMFQGVDTLIIAGYAVRVLLLIILGAFLVWINSEDDLRKALQIGIMAPAIIVGFMNGAELHNAKVELEVQALTGRAEAFLPRSSHPSMRGRTAGWPHGGVHHGTG